ncbi:MFS transporter [Jatrophihabitans endophyticus]|uniref:MFS transporter n=1 Tax=Jatrophihabitans endophyticus TaxID=1206085 RepID=UPI001F205BC2|nr:MFS transporter [Jatrophihabitans endophyticus]
MTRSAAPTRSVAAPLRRARAATFGYFGLNGFLLGVWVVHIPTIERRAGISHATLGWLLLLLGLGAFAGMHIVGPLADRLGARRVVPVSAVLCSVALAGPGLATNGWTLGLALLVLGFGNGCLDVSMNTHAVQVEAGYARPVMSAFHAVFSVGGFAAALVGARTLAWELSPRVTLSIVAAIGAVLALLAVGALLPARPSASPADVTAAGADDADSSSAPAHAATRRRIRVLAAVAFMLMLSEGVANDWSTIAARDGLGVSPATAALAYGAFAGAMTVGRFVADRVAARAGAVAILRWGAAVAAVALAIVVLSPSIAVTIVGWALFGLGLSGTVPQLFSAAGHADPATAGANVSRVAGLGYLGMLAGPAVIGPLTHLVEIRHAFVLPLLLCAIAAAAAPAVDARRATAAGEPHPVAP